MSRTLAVVVSGRPLFRKTFSKILLVLESGLQVHEHAGDLEELDSLPSWNQGLLVLDCGTLDERAIVDQMLQVLARQPEACLVVVIDEQDDQRVDAAMNTGAAGVLVKATPPQVMVDMLQRVLDGDRCRPAPVTTVAREEIPEAMRSQLSARQQKLLRLMMGGQSISSTALTLGLTPAKVVTEMRVVLGIIRGRGY